MLLIIIIVIIMTKKKVMRYRLWCARMEIKIFAFCDFVVALDISTHTDHIITEKCLRLIINHRRPRLMWTHILKHEGNFRLCRVNDMFLMNGNSLPVHETWGSSYNAGLHRTTNVSMLCQQIKMHFKAIQIVLTSDRDMRKEFLDFFFLSLLMFKISFVWWEFAGRGFFHL